MTKFGVIAFGWLVVIMTVAILIAYWNQPVLPCQKLVAMSHTCIPFGCTKTYINERGEDTGECG